MTQIIEFNSKKNILTVEDFFDLSKLMYSLPRWRGMDKFKNLYENIEINLDDKTLKQKKIKDTLVSTDISKNKINDY